MSFEWKNAHSNTLFLRHEIIKLPDKIIMENCLFINKSINFNSLQFSIIFTFTSDSKNHETSRSSKGFLKVKALKAKAYGKEAMIDNAILSWNNIQKIISSGVLCDLLYSNLKSLLVKHFLKTYSNND